MADAPDLATRVEQLEANEFAAPVDAETNEKSG
jgi:hypothetical protein